MYCGTTGTGLGIKYLDENIGALDIQISKKEMEEINAIAPKGAAAGMRYPETMMHTVGR
jgi:diketogulonate reductase-like aldo/keto reductase